MIRFFNIYVLFLVLLISNSISATNCHYKNIDLESDKYFLIEQEDSIHSLTIEARLSVSKNKERAGLSKSKWRVVWNYSSSLNYDFVELTWENTNFGDIYDCRQAILSIGSVKDGVDKLYKSEKLKDGVNLSTGSNSIMVEIASGHLNLFVGDKQLKYIETYEVETLLGSFCGVISNVDAKVSNLIVETVLNKECRLQTSYKEQDLLLQFLSSANGDEGFWTYLDRDVDLDYARLGGKYRLALVKNNEGYLIIYIDGAETNKYKWREGMIKGVLKSTIFKNHYDLVWYDSTFDVIDCEANAFIENSILTLNFPLYKSSIRFFKEKF